MDAKGLEVKSCHPLVINLSCDKQLDMELRCNMVVGIIKHILYFREQIPQSYELLTLPLSNSKETNQQHVQDSKRDTLVQQFEELFTKLDEILMENKLEVCAVRRVVVALGSTFMSAKEIHCIEVPKILEEIRQPLSQIYTKKQVQSQIFHSLFVSSNAVQWAPFSPTNIHILVEMDRNCKQDWFMPKPIYKLREENNSKLTIYRWNCSKSDKPQKMDENRNDDLVWFLTPLTIKGFS